MQSTEFLITVNDHLGLPFDRVTKLATALRKAGHYPDGRSGGHVSATQAAYLLSLMALSPNPYNDGADTAIKKLAELKSDNGESFISAFARLLSHNGEQIFIEGVTRVALSLDRDLALIVFKSPAHQEALATAETPIENYVTRESEKSFGDPSPRKVERFVFLKKSLLLEISAALANTGHDLVGDALPQREKILDKINNV
jgi:hypothetical protein